MELTNLFKQSFKKLKSYLYIDKALLKEKIDNNGSFLKFMPDNKKLFKILKLSSYNIFYNDSQNKLSSLIATAIDSFSRDILCYVAHEKGYYFKKMIKILKV